MHSHRISLIAANILAEEFLGAGYILARGGALDLRRNVVAVHLRCAADEWWRTLADTRIRSGVAARPPGSWPRKPPSTTGVSCNFEDFTSSPPAYKTAAYLNQLRLHSNYPGGNAAFKAK
jgi:hypothetical protein